MSVGMEKERLDHIQNKAELDHCSFVKGILMLLVMLYHSILFWRGDWFTADPQMAAPLLSTAARWMQSFHIYGFTLASGYIFYYVKYERNGYQKYGAFVWNKAMRLLIPYAFTALIWVIPMQHHFLPDTLSAYFLKFGLGTSPGQLWFLLMLFSLFVIAWPMSDFLARHHWLGLAAVVLLYGAGMVGKRIVPDVYQVWTACQYLLYFWLGFKIRQCGSKYIRKLPGYVWLGLQIGLYALNVHIGSYPSDGIIRLLKAGLPILVQMVGAIMAFVVLQEIADRTKWQKNRFLQKMIKYAMPLYLFHQQVIYFLIKAFNGLISPYLHGAVNFAGALLVSSAIAWVLMRFRWTRRLIGEK